MKQLDLAEKDIKKIKKEVSEMSAPEKKVLEPKVKRFKLRLDKLLKTIEKLEKDKKVIEELNKEMADISASSDIKQAKKATQVIHVIEQYKKRLNYDNHIVNGVILEVKSEIDDLISEVTKFPSHPESITLLQDLRSLATRLEPIVSFHM